VIVLVRRPAESGLRRLQHAFRLPVSPDERDADGVKARGDARAHLELRVRRVHVLLELGIALRVAGEVLRAGHPLRFAADGEPLQPRAGDAEITLATLSKPS